MSTLGRLALVVVGCVLLASQTTAAEAVPDLCTAGGWVLQEQCSPLLHLRSGSSICCSTLRGLQELGCFCHIRYSHLIPSLDLWNVLALCGLEVETDGDRLCFSSRLGVDAEALTDKQAEFKQETISQDAPEKELEAIDYRPVLDLSSIPDSVTTIFQRSSNGQVTIRYSEKLDSNGDSTLSLDVDMPDATDFDIDLEYSLQSQDSDRIFIDSDVLLEGLPLVDFDAESDPEALNFDNDNAISDLATEEILVEGLAEVLSRPEPCHQQAGTEEEPMPSSMELSVSLPEGFLQAFNDSDVNIDMEFDPEGEGSFSSAAITLDDGVLESSFNGKAIGSLLKEAAQYLSSELSIPLASGFSERQILQSSSKSVFPSKGSLLRGALGFLATVGEDIRDSIPDKQLHDGDVIQIQHDAETMQLGELQEPLPAKEQDHRSLVAFAGAIRSALRHSHVEEQGSSSGACTVCALVHKYISALWAIVIAGFAVLIYCGVSASIRAFLEPAPTDPNRDLERPLIVSAADYVKGGPMGDALLLPVWSPPKSLR